MALNDLELYDTETDPGELHHLASHPEAAREQVMRMNARLNRLLAKEVGVDDGRHLPGPARFWRAS